MEAQLQALSEIRDFLNQHAIPHMVIGGLANAVWGRSRATLDADLKVIIGDRSIADFVQLISTSFVFRVPDPMAFARKTYVLPILASNRIGIDLGLSFLPYETEAIDRAIMIDYEGVVFPVCTPEDLIIHKAISERDKDLMDVEGILARQRGNLDQTYIMAWLRQFADALERPNLVGRYEAACQQAGIAT